MKTCSTCKIEQPVSEFYKHSQTKDGLRSQCKKCHTVVINNRKKQTKYWITYNQIEENRIKRNQSVYNWERKKQGVYGWFDGDIALYVGQSKRLNSRISIHKCWLKNPTTAPKVHYNLYLSLQQHKNASISIIEECSPEVLLEREKHYINTLKPLYNHDGN